MDFPRSDRGRRSDSVPQRTGNRAAARDNKAVSFVFIVFAGVVELSLTKTTLSRSGGTFTVMVLVRSVRDAARR